jgi:hypothetical protein
MVVEPLSTLGGALRLRRELAHSIWDAHAKTSPATTVVRQCSTKTIERAS